MSEEGEGEALCTRDVDASRLVLSSARRGTRTARETCTDYTRIYQDCIYQDMPGYASAAVLPTAVRLERMRMHGHLPVP